MGLFVPHRKPQCANGGQGGLRWPPYWKLQSTRDEQIPFQKSFSTIWPQIFFHGEITNQFSNSQGIPYPGLNCDLPKILQKMLEQAQPIWLVVVILQKCHILYLLVFLMAGMNCHKDSGGELHGGWKSLGIIRPSRAASVYAQTTLQQHCHAEMQSKCCRVCINYSAASVQWTTKAK